MRVIDGNTGKVIEEIPSQYTPETYQEEPEIPEDRWGEMPGAESWEEAKSSGINPALWGAAKLQQFLGRSPTLPALYGVLGSGIAAKTPLVAKPGAVGAVGGVGKSVGERLRKMIRGEEWAYAPTGNEALNVGEGIAGDIILRGLGKLLQPVKTLKSLEKSSVARAGERGFTFDTTPIEKTGENFVLRHPEMKTEWNVIKQGVKNIGDPTQFTEMLSDWWEQGTSETGLKKRLIKSLWDTARPLYAQGLRNASFARSLESALIKVGALKALAPAGILAWGLGQAGKAIGESLNIGGGE